MVEAAGVPLLERRSRWVNHVFYFLLLSGEVIAAQQAARLFIVEAWGSSPCD